MPNGKHGEPWTGEEDSELKLLIGDGSTYEEAARYLGRTWGACANRAAKLGIGPGKKGRPPDIDRRAWVLSLLRRNLNLRAIARVTGTCPENIITLVRLMVRDGLVRRVGPPRGKGCDPKSVRYVPVE